MTKHRQTTGYCYKKQLLIKFLLLLVTYPSFAQEDSPAHIGIVYPLSTHGKQAANYSNTISIHAIAGLSGGEKAFSLYGVAGIVKGDVQGFQSSGVLNKVSGTLSGFQLAGVVNLTAASVGGWQYAGVFNQTKGTAHAQISGLANRGEYIKGLQFAGVFNVADDIQGAQISGLVNKAKQVSGIQLGVLNIAEKSDYPIGIVNIIKDGEMSLGLGTDENLSTFVTFRSGGRLLYGILGIGLNPQYESLRFGAEGGMGAKLITGEQFRLATEIVSTTLTDFDGNYFNKNSLRILPAVKISKKIYLYGGPSINYINTDNEDGKRLVQLKIWDRQRTKDYQAFNVGFTGGLQLIL